MNPGLDELKPYPFERLAEIRARVDPPGDRTLIDLSIGEPQHPTPAIIRDALVDALEGTARYPANPRLIRIARNHRRVGEPAISHLRRAFDGRPSRGCRSTAREKPCSASRNA